MHLGHCTLKRLASPASVCAAQTQEVGISCSTVDKAMMYHISIRKKMYPTNGLRGVGGGLGSLRRIKTPTQARWMRRQVASSDKMSQITVPEIDYDEADDESKFCGEGGA